MKLNFEIQAGSFLVYVQPSLGNEQKNENLAWHHELTERGFCISQLFVESLSQL